MTSHKLCKLLDKRPWYSYSVKHVRSKLKITRKQLLGMIMLAEEQINVFEYNGVEFIGLERRRLDYERDKANGTNHVEDLIKFGHYHHTPGCVLL